VRISGSLWSVPVQERAATLVNALDAGLAAVHWDCTDGRFAAPGGFTSAEALALLANTPGVESEAHLMVEDPISEVDEWADWCATVVVPVEVGDPWPALRRVEARGAKAALAVSLETPLELVPHGTFAVLVMAIPPGRAGSRFADSALSRVAELRRRGCHAQVGVDGGVGPAQFESLSEAGADWIVSGTSLFGAPDVGEWLARCRKAFLG
jgi:ribulose-phosphate 3-epimerase